MEQPLALVVHAHFYQPPRENPWTEEVAREATAAPFHDWNTRIASECYRPNAYARIVDERGRVVGIVNNYEHLSFDVGATLTSWLEAHEPDTYRRIIDADARRGGAIAQAFFHVILPLAPERDVRTQVRWGMAEFEHRFGRRPGGIWLPETAVNDVVLAVLAEEGVGFTILAPSQATRVRPLGRGDDAWADVADGSIDTRRPYRWCHPAGDGRGVDLVFYDGGLSHAVAFELGNLSSQALLDRVEAAGRDRRGVVTVAADGETFGHHHRYGDRLLAYALAVEAPRRGIRVTTAAGELRRAPPVDEVQVRESAWSCAHGVGRWREDCGCATGGQRGWNQRWRAPLRAALDVVARAVDEAYERRGPPVLADPWDARDAYVHVLVGAMGREEFAARHVTGDPVEAFTLLEAQRHRLAMYTSCGWFFHDLAGLETVQVLRYAARALDCLAELGEPSCLGRVLDVLADAHSNVAAEGDGRQVWARHVETARVDAERVVAHLALVELLEGRAPSPRVAVFDVEVREHAHADRGALALCTGHLVLTHVRTGWASEHVYAAVHLGGLEVLGATRAPDAARDGPAFGALRSAFAGGAPVTTLLRLVADGFGPRKFGLRSALPGAAEQILRRAAVGLADRFTAAYDQLFADHRATLVALAATGYPLPAELRAPAELALARRLEAELAAQGGSLDPADYQTAVAVAREAEASGVAIATAAATAAVERLIVGTVERAVQDRAGVEAALGALRLSADLGLQPSLARPQELVYEALVGGDRHPELTRLGEALGLAVEPVVGRPDR